MHPEFFAVLEVHPQFAFCLSQIDLDANTILRVAIYVPESYTHKRGCNTKLVSILGEIACDLEAPLEHYRLI
jgi:hypothetical protein